MSTKIDSKRLESFPSTKRAALNKLFTENSVTRLINRLIDKDSYVITTELADVDFSDDIPIDVWNGSNADFEFVIRGYYFSIAKGDSESGLAYLLNETNFNFDPSEINEHTLFARIFIDKTDSDFPELYGQDDIGDKYQAVSFFIDNEEPDYPDGEDYLKYEYYDAPLVRYLPNKAGRYVTLDCLHKFDSRSILDIDGGEIKING